MESNGVSRAPLTRSRRRISLELAEEVVKTPLTPTKKKGRATAKPQLDDIDENTPINSPRKSRRNSVKDILDAVKSDTPTSGLTPARRSSRIISNTSITNENTQNYESPRALRSSRRLSRTGSDADTPTLTPTKTLRRTRTSIANNDSSSESSNPVSQQLINEIIPEETQQLNTSTKSHNKEKVRKSPRLSAKPNSENSTPEKDKPIEHNIDDNITNEAEIQSSATTTNKTVQGSPKHPHNKDLNNTVPCYNSDKCNRTNSLNISGKSENISTPSFFSDNEDGRVKVKKSRKHLITNEKENIQNKDQVDACFIGHSLNINHDGLVLMSRISKNKSQIVIEHVKDDSKQKVDFIEDSCSPDKSATLMNQESEDQCVPEVKPLAEDKDILEPKLSTTLSSNTKQIGFMSKLERTTTDLSCEPMDIDETIPENVTVLDHSNEKIESLIKTGPTDNQEKEMSNTSQNSTKRKLSITNELELSKNINKSSFNASKVANTSVQAIDTEKDHSNTKIENSKKNKLNVSEIVHNKSFNREKLDVSQSDAKNNKTQDNSTRKSLDTPVKISTQNILGMQTSTPVDNQPKLSTNKLRKVPKKSDDSDTDIQPVKKGKKAILLESDDSSVESDDTNKLVIEEAEEAPDEYESGDSMDEEERQYLEENEIVEKGESIRSDTTDYSSDESDYDKDSFLVSSDEEDNELLSGSGDDLSMSDNELSMSKKSKAKYDKRKLKEQKRASREMYEARHGKNNDLDSSRSSQGQDQEISVIKGISHNRMRIESEVTETEISAIVNESIMDKQDPLKKVIKVEPKTPQNSFNISSTNIQPNVEHLEIDENATLMKSNTTQDPLENNSDDDDSSLCSENEEIKDNYDSLLSNLNKDKKNHQKKIPKIQENYKTIDGKEVRDSDTSDSININLLFPENNSDSDSSNGKSNHKKELFISDENFIPLKRVDGKTDLRENEGTNSITSSVAEDRITKKLSETMPIQLDGGTSKLIKPNKNKILSQSLTQAEYGTNQLLNAKKKKTTSESSMTNQSNNDANLSLNSKKKKTSSESSWTIQSEKDVNQSLNPKKKKTSLEPSITSQTESNANQSLNSKKKKTSESSITNQSESDVIQSLNSKKVKTSSESSMAEKSLISKKKNTSFESSMTNQSETDANQSLNSKKKKTSSETSMTQKEQDDNQSLTSKKIKTSSESFITNQTGQESNKSLNSKQNRSKLESSLTSQTEHDTNQLFKSKEKKSSSESSTIQKEHDVNQSFKSKKNVTNQSAYETYQSLNLNKKEQKTKNKLCQSSDDSTCANENHKLNKGNEVSHLSEQNIDPKSNIAKVNPGKGRKRKMSDSFIESSYIERTEQDHKSMNSKKKKKQAQSDVLKENTDYSAINVRKRKQRPEEDNRKNKILSGFLDKLPVPRLPTTVLDQLDEKAKTNVLSTTKFSVDSTSKKKMKPSEYLEDSVYLNSQSPEKKRRKKLHRKPKVLPFVPTACTSGSGFTTSFQISIVPKVIEFVAQSSVASNFKMDKMKNTKQSASKYKPQKKTANISKY